MQKIIIKNFGPIKDAEIVITPLLVLIGEQATGKSTIAKLIYFFKSLSGFFMNRYYASENVEVDYTHDINLMTRDKFYDYFGSTLHMEDFKIVFYYDDTRFISLSLNTKRKLEPYICKGFFPKGLHKRLISCKKTLLELRHNIEVEELLTKKIILEHEQLTQLNNMSGIIDDIFCNYHNDSAFVIAGRNATIGYSNFFESMLAANLQKRLEDMGTKKFDAKEQTIEETLMLDFLQRVSKMRQFLNKSGDFQGVIQNAQKNKKETLTLAYSFIQKVIRGNYISGADEKIALKDGKFIYLKNASSGQQESIRILQDAFIAINSDNNVLRIIEEPEAHIFPEAQLYLIQLLVMLLNNKEQNQMIITTHSPYVLSVINNLMFAHKVGQSSPDKVNKIIKKDSWLAPEKVNAYMLTAANGAERIIDDELNMIKSERIDEVSEKLNDDYDKLLNIEYEKEEN